MQLLTVVGARPQFIKAAAVSRTIGRTQGGEGPIVEQILHTGQHFDAAMSDQFFSELGIPEPTFHLGIGGGSHGANTGRMLEAIERVLLEERPDAVLLYGDTDPPWLEPWPSASSRSRRCTWRRGCVRLTGTSRKSKTGCSSITWRSSALPPPIRPLAICSGNASLRNESCAPAM